MSSVQQEHAPIAVFAYNRPDRLAAMMKSLQACHGFAESPVRVFVDGPKRSSDAHLVEAVRDFVRELDLPNLSWSFHEANRGLRNSISAGVSEIIDQYGRAIVLEDDLVLSRVALDFFNRGLQRYEADTRVWSVVGYAYDAPSLRQSATARALPFAHPWGWATWDRSWRHFDLDNRPTLDELNSKAFKASFDMNGLYPFTSQLKNSIEGRVDSWFIHWYYTVFKNGGVSIFPPRRLVDNHGFRDGTHGGSLNPYSTLVKPPDLLEKVPDFCDPNDVDYSALDALKNSRELRVQRSIARAGSAKRSLTARGMKH